MSPEAPAGSASRLRELIEIAKELKVAVACCMRVLTDIDAGAILKLGKDSYCERFVDEMHVSGVADGIGVRAEEAIANAEQLLQAPAEAAAVGWQPIETAPRNEEAWFWVRPKTADETYRDTSGNPILASHAPYLSQCKYGHWNSLETADYWHPLRLPAPPVAGGDRAPARAEAPDEDLPPGLAASLALFREDPDEWHREWTRKHEFKVKLLEKVRALEAARAEAPRIGQSADEVFAESVRQELQELAAEAPPAPQEPEP